MLSLANELQKRGHTVEIFISALNAENNYPDLLRNLNVTVIPHPLDKKMPRWLTPMGDAEATQKAAAGAGGKVASALRGRTNCRAPTKKNLNCMHLFVKCLRPNNSSLSVSRRRDA